MRLLDSLHNWAAGTTRQYQGKLRQLRSFQQAHPGLDVLSPGDFLAPARGPEIGLMWAELDASVRPLRVRGRSAKGTPVFTTVRQLRSAASQLHGWNLITTRPSGTLYFQDRRLLSGAVRPTDTASYEMFSRGLQARMGDEAVPSTALLGRHIRGLDNLFDVQFRAATTDAARELLALAGFANLLLWTSWLRGGELFNLRWEDVGLIWPHEAPAYDLPANTGAILLSLLPETKSSRSLKADVLVAMRTATGLTLDLWLRRVLIFHDRAPDPSARVFQPRAGFPSPRGLLYLPGIALRGCSGSRRERVTT